MPEVQKLIGRREQAAEGALVELNDESNEARRVNLGLLIGSVLLTLAILFFVLLVVGCFTGCAAREPRLPGLL